MLPVARLTLPGGRLTWCGLALAARALQRADVIGFQRIVPEAGG